MGVNMIFSLDKAGGPGGICIFVISIFSVVLIMEGRKISVVAMGAGNRMVTYGAYASLHPEEMVIVAVVEPNLLRRESFAREYGIPQERCFTGWQEFLAQDRMADAVFICTPDNMHYEPAMLALRRGYHIFLEKPIAQSWQECLDIAALARKMGKVVGVGHVLRYHPYFKKMKEVLEEGCLGKLISVNHVEAIGIERMTHAFVRGLWRREEETNPLILSKACHDLDLLVWLTGKLCRQVASFGSLKWFKADNAPQGSTLRCTDGCVVERQCPYSALDLYFRRKRWLRHFDLPQGADMEEVIMQELKTGPYGRCVYRCDNTVVDHQVVSMLMEEDITVNLSLDAFTRDSGRKTHFMCSEGEMSGDEKTLTVRYFHPGREACRYDFSSNAGECNYHGGADLNIVGDFIAALREGDGRHLRTGIESCLESHRVAFEIEKIRLTDR